MSSSGSSHSGRTLDGPTRASKPSTPDGAALGPAIEQELYTTLGSLLGMLEVMSSDAREPLHERHRAWLHEALRHGHALKAQLEALVVLFVKPPDHVERRPLSLRRMVEHAVRGAAWGDTARRVHVSLPRDDGFDELEIHADAQLLERVLRGVAEHILGVVGEDGMLEVGFARRAGSVELSLHGRAGALAPDGANGLSELLCAAWTKVAALHGGSLVVDASAVRAVLALPLEPTGG